MRSSEITIQTLKDTPTDAELISHQLMLRSGLIKRVASGIYAFMPLGLKILRKIEAIIREEMNKIGAQEMLMPMVQPLELWQESSREEHYGKELLRFSDRLERNFCLGPTHEELVIDLVRGNIKSYKQLPFTFYQIQTKFRDEVRPRFGVLRSREFIMKDAYSFHENYESLTTTYWKMHEAYCNIFTRLGLNFRAVQADTGSIGGTDSHEFQVLCNSGEDTIVYSEESDYAANIELATCRRLINERATSQESLKKVATPSQKTCLEVAKLLNLPLQRTVKSIVLEAKDGGVVLALLRGDHELNETKISKITNVKTPFTLATSELINKYFGCEPGFIGPVGFSGTIIVDLDVDVMSDFVCGANDTGYHLTGVNFTDINGNIIVADIRNVNEGDIEPNGQGTLKLCRGIEVGHIFQLRTKYSSSMKFNVLDANGKSTPVEMGCYGIGVSRILGALIEQNHDDKGMIFPLSVAPFEVIMVPVFYNKSESVANICNKLYEDLKNSNIDVLLDDRNERIGSLLADSELLGIPYRIVISDKNLVNDQAEFFERKTNTTSLIKIDEVAAKLKLLIKPRYSSTC